MAALFISKNAAAALGSLRCHLHCPASIPTYGYPNYGNDGCDGFAPNFPRTGLRNDIQFVGTGSIAIIAWNLIFVKLAVFWQLLKAVASALENVKNAHSGMRLSFWVIPSDLSGEIILEAGVSAGTDIGGILQDERCITGIVITAAVHIGGSFLYIG